MHSCGKRIIITRVRDVFHDDVPRQNWRKADEKKNSNRCKMYAQRTTLGRITFHNATVKSTSTSTYMVAEKEFPGFSITSPHIYTFMCPPICFLQALTLI